MPVAINKKSESFLYQQVVSLIQQMKTEGTLKPGDKLPSLRNLSTKLNISIPTVKQAYIELERLGFITARPKSGYYLNAVLSELNQPRMSRLANRPVTVNCQTLIEEVYQVAHTPGMVSLGVANPASAYPSDKALGRLMRRAITRAGDKVNRYAPVLGYEELRRQIAYRHLDFGLHVDPDHVLITNGAQEALTIALQCVAKPGDVIAVESPAYFGLLELIENLGMMALEIPACSNTGLCLDDLQMALENNDVKACMFSTAINNPLGSYMNDERRQRMVEIVESFNIPLIEDDVYGELYFHGERPKPASHWSKKGLVLTCSSFSKTASPSYRVGWLITEKFINPAERFKRAMSCSCSLLNQWVMTDFISSGAYDRNVSQLRNVLRINKERMASLMLKAFPEGTCISDPQGASVFWVQFPNRLDTTKLFHVAAEKNISIAPGRIFSASKKFKNFARISYGEPWSERIEEAIAELGKIAHDLLTN